MCIETVEFTGIIRLRRLRDRRPRSVRDAESSRARTQVPADPLQLRVQRERPAHVRREEPTRVQRRQRLREGIVPSGRTRRIHSRGRVQRRRPQRFQCRSQEDRWRPQDAELQTSLLLACIKSRVHASISSFSSPTVLL